MPISMTRHALRMLAVLVLLGVAAFPIYWMLVTSLTPTQALFADQPQLLPSLGQLPVYASVFSLKPVKSKQRKKIVSALKKKGKKRPKVKAKLTGKIVDQVGNRFTRNLTVSLLPAKRKRR